MTAAFWDTSALVPLCIEQPASSMARSLLERHSIAVWWATSVEMHSAFERLARMGLLPAAEHALAVKRL